MLYEVITTTDKIIGYLKCYNALKLCGIKFDLIFTFDDKGEYDRAFYNLLTEIAYSLCLCESISVITSYSIHYTKLYE